MLFQQDNGLALRKESDPIDIASFSDGDGDLSLSEDEDMGPSGPRYTHQRRLQTLNALFVQTNQQLDEPAWCASAPRNEDPLFQLSVPVFVVANLTEAELATVRARLEQDDDEDPEEKSFAYVQAPFPLPLTGRVDPASVDGGWPPALRQHMVQSVLGLRERLLKPEALSMAIMIDPDTPRDGFVTLLYLTNEDELQTTHQAARLARWGITQGLDLYVREGVRVKAEEAWIALTTAELNETMDEAVEPHAQSIAPWPAPYGAQDVHQHLP